MTQKANQRCFLQDDSWVDQRLVQPGSSALFVKWKTKSQPAAICKSKGSGGNKLWFSLAIVKNQITASRNLQIQGQPPQQALISSVYTKRQVENAQDAPMLPAR
jgi:hypothetical protein